MKKLILLFLTSTLLISSCGINNNTDAPQSDNPPTTTTKSTDEFYSKYNNATKRPIAVMIDNDDKTAWPHAGLNDAYLIYEMLVEGGATRLMALFNDTSTAKIGPVRSSRHYFLDYALEHNAIYVHFGWSPRAQTDITDLGVNNINGVLGGDGNIFWREEKFKGDYHSAYTSIENIENITKTKGYKTERTVAPLKFGEKDNEISGKDVSSISFQFSGIYRSGFEYNAEAKEFTRFMNGSPHTLQDGTTLSAKNIIVMHVNSYPLGDGSPRLNLSTVGTGKGYYLTLGKYIPIIWEKQGRTKATSYKTEQGQDITLNPGHTWIVLVPGNLTPSIK